MLEELAEGEERIGMVRNVFGIGKLGQASVMDGQMWGLGLPKL